MRMAEWLCDRYAATLPEAVSAIPPASLSRARSRSRCRPA
ncbi:hypothetical protein [Alicyclobacillus acidocaldarius]